MNRDSRGDLSFEDGSTPVAGHWQWLSPAHGTVIGVALNHVRQREVLRDAFLAPPHHEPPKTPVLFIKPENCINAHEAPVAVPASAKSIRVNGALAMVIGRAARRVAAARAMEIVKGYTIFNDCALAESSFLRPPVRSKCHDGFGPLGPVVVPVQRIPDPHNLSVRTLLNGTLAYELHTGDLYWKAPQLIEFITSFMTLREGDVISLGFPEIAIEAQAGDTVDIEIEPVGRLSNRIVNEADLPVSQAGELAA